MKLFSPQEFLECGFAQHTIITPPPLLTPPVGEGSLYFSLSLPVIIPPMSQIHQVEKAGLYVNLLAPELFFLILAHPVYKM